MNKGKEKGRREFALCTHPSCGNSVAQPTCGAIPFLLFTGGVVASIHAATASAVAVAIICRHAEEDKDPLALPLTLTLTHSLLPLLSRWI